MSCCASIHPQPGVNHATARRVMLRAFAAALALGAIVLVADGQRWLLQHTALQSVEYTAATCAVDALYGEPHSVAATACTTSANPEGKSL
jgi:hypothetical protein